MKNLESIISKLKAKDEVDAVFITGSQGVGQEKNYSDIDLGIVLVNGTDLSGVSFRVDDKQCDGYFFTTNSLQATLDASSISPNDREGLIVNFLEKADICFDKSGTLTKCVEQIADTQKKLSVPEAKKVWFESVINSAFRTNKRYFESGQLDYHEALEIKLQSDLDLLLKGYFELRGVPWKGERQVTEYLKKSDPGYWELYVSCIRTPDLQQKFAMYCSLVEKNFYGDYKKWEDHSTHVFAGNKVGRKGEEHLLKFWNTLIS